MVSIAHILVAGTIARAVPDPILAPALSLTSHYMLDCIPHWDFGTNWRGRSKWTTGAAAITETGIGFGIGWLLFYQSVPPLVLFLSFIASVLPDWLETPWYIFFAEPKKFKPEKNAGFWEKTTFNIYKLQNVFHTKAPSMIFGLATQVITVAFFFVLLA